MNRSSIEWTNFTANPLRYRDKDGNVVHACIHKSGGCLHCYAEVMAKRWGRHGLPFTAENMKLLTPFLDENELHRMLTYKRATGKMCFVGDMTDIFGEWVPDELLDRLFAVFALRPDVTWQVLTKRAERMRQYLSENGPGVRIGEHLMDLARGHGGAEVTAIDRVHKTICGGLTNVWLGVSAEDQKNADERIPSLLQVPAPVHFISYEPALGPIDFSMFLNRFGAQRKDWILLGGESGPGARPFNLQWARQAIAQCEAAGTACFVKQLGAKPYLEIDQTTEKKTPAMTLSIRDLEIEETIRLKDRKGGSMEEWPEDLRVREWPR